MEINLAQNFTKKEACQKYMYVYKIDTLLSCI